jgi:hypothetical protein
VPDAITGQESGRWEAIAGGNQGGGPTTIEWTFEPHDNGSTFVGIMERGFKGDADEVVTQVKNSTEGFSLVLAGLKAFLEHNIRLNLVADRFPKGIEE